MITPHGRGSRAVLFGTATYSNSALAEIPAALNNIADLRDILTSTGGAFTPEHCVALPDPVSGEQIGRAVAQAAGEATDILFVYYTGHGVLDSRGRLYLTVIGTDPTQPSWTAVPFQTLREEILESRARARILILDCCFSGRAFEALSDTAGVIAGETGIRGTYTITSSAANQTSFAPLGHRNTAFTAALLTAADTVGLTLDELYRRTEQHLIEYGHPRPQRRAIDTAGELKLLGDTREHRYLRAARAGDSDAMFALGYLLNQRGELSEAETWYRKAIKAGHSAAMHNLGCLLEQRGELGEAESWYRKAAEAGDSAAMHNLGYLLEQRGELGEAESWYRKAAEAGKNSRAMNNLGLLLKQRGELSEAETWWRKAIKAGHSGAMFNLGYLLNQRGELSEAETWYRKAIKAGNSGAMFSLGYLLTQRGELSEAETWYRKAAEAGESRAMRFLGDLLAQRGERVEAEIWHRRAGA